MRRGTEDGLCPSTPRRLAEKESRPEEDTDEEGALGLCDVDQTNLCG